MTQHSTTPYIPGRNPTTMTTAQASRTLYGPDGQALTTSAETPAPAATGDWAPVRTADNLTVWEKPLAPAVRPHVELVRDDENATARKEADTLRAEAQRILDESKATADQIEAAAKDQAEFTTNEARSLKARTLGAADAEAKRIREEAAAEIATKKKRGARLDVIMARAAVFGAIGLTASGEYMLARMANFPWQVAWLLPMVIDVYVIQAFRRKRDTYQAIALTIMTNVAYHLADVGMFGVTPGNKPNTYEPEWWLIAMVASIASIILWRMHLITEDHPAKRESRRDQRRRERAEDARAVMPVSVEMADAVAQQTPENGGPDVNSDGEERLTTPTPISATRPATIPANGSAKNGGTVSAPVRHDKPSDQPKPRRLVSQKSATNGGSESDRQVAKLVALMRQRGSADAVTATDAVRVTGATERTAYRRLKTARDRFAQTAN